MARLPLITQRREIDVRVVFGQSIFELYQQIQNLLQREALTLSNFFAEPIVNAVRGEIAWNTRAVGAARLAAHLSPEEWAQANQQLKQNIESVKQLIGKLEKAGQGNSAGAEALRCMLMTPDLRRSLFLVGDELVLTQWGCYQFGTDARSADLFEQIERQPKFTPPPPPIPASEPPESPPPVTPPPVTPPRVTPPPVTPPPPSGDTPPPARETEPPGTTPVPDSPFTTTKSRSYFWRWLLLLLLLLLLLIGIFWKYWQSHDWNSEAALRAEVAELWQKVDKKARDCGLLPPTPGSSTPPPQAPVTNQEFRERQSENNIKPDSKVNVSLAWNDRADLDLIVKQPDGQEVYFKPCASATCGTLDADANYCDPRTPCTNLKEKPLENISWRGQMPRGRYEVFVGLYSTNRAAAESLPVPFTVQVTKDGKPTTYQGVVRREEMTCKEQCTSGLRRIAEFTIE